VYLKDVYSVIDWILERNLLNLPLGGGTVPAGLPTPGTSSRIDFIAVKSTISLNSNLVFNLFRENRWYVKPAVLQLLIFFCICKYVASIEPQTS